MVALMIRAVIDTTPPRKDRYPWFASVLLSLKYTPFRFLELRLDTLGCTEKLGTAIGDDHLFFFAAVVQVARSEYQRFSPRVERRNANRYRCFTTVALSNRVSRRLQHSVRTTVSFLDFPNLQPCGFRYGKVPCPKIAVHTVALLAAGVGHTSSASDQVAAPSMHTSRTSVGS